MVRESGGGREVLGVQTDAGAKSAKPIDTLPFPVLAPGESTPAFLTKLTGVPATILVDGSGKIEKLFYGPPEGENAQARARGAQGARMTLREAPASAVSRKPSAA